MLVSVCRYAKAMIYACKHTFTVGLFCCNKKGKEKTKPGKTKAIVCVCGFAGSKGRRANMVNSKKQNEQRKSRHDNSEKRKRKSSLNGPFSLSLLPLTVN